MNHLANLCCLYTKFFLFSTSTLIFPSKSPKMLPTCCQDTIIKVWLQEFFSATSFQLLVLPSKYWYCVHCLSLFRPYSKKDVKDHVKSNKHNIWILSSLLFPILERIQITPYVSTLNSSDTNYVKIYQCLHSSTKAEKPRKYCIRGEHHWSQHVML